LKKHTFYYFTDNLTAYVSWRTAWDIWLSQVEKDSDEYTVNGLEMETHMGQMYLGKAVVELTEKEFLSFGA
jgi:hypothetical protein